METDSQLISISRCCQIEASEDMEGLDTSTVISLKVQCAQCVVNASLLLGIMSGIEQVA